MKTKTLRYIFLAFFFVPLFVLAQTEAKLTFRVAGNCGMCKDRIEEAARTVDGVVSANWDDEKQMIVVLGNELDQKAIEKTIAIVGHDTENCKTPEDIYKDLHTCCKYRDNLDLHPRGVSLNKKNSEEKLAFRVAGNCGMCKDRIEEATKTVNGVVSADWDDEKQEIVVLGNKLDQKAIEEAISRAGHDTENYKTPENVYNKLHSCCKYRDNHNLHSGENRSKKKHLPEEKEHNVKEKSDTDSEKEDSDCKGDCSDCESECSGCEKECSSSEKGFSYSKKKLKTDSDEVTGIVLGVSKKGKSPLVGANVYWLGTTLGSTTDKEGYFRVKSTEKTDKLVVSFVGFQNDTLFTASGSSYRVELVDEVYLDEVTVVGRQKTTAISHLSAIKSLKVSEGELEKAACCNLSESFETNPTVDVAFTDAVTGTRQIQMLGLAGPYVQITRENVPDIRGLSAIHGLTYTPGTWVESIQLNLGTGSVANGYESVTGQINVELKKPEKAERAYLNLFSSHVGMAEGNLNLMYKLNKNWSTGVLLHGKYFDNELDDNEDGFLDAPLTKNFIALNRWKYNSGHGEEGQFGIKVTSLESTSGQKGYTDDATNALWGADMQTQRAEAWAKMGYVSDGRPTRSLGLQLSGLYHDQKSDWGSRNYDATQKTLYGNLIFQDVFRDTDHKYRVGVSFMADLLEEEVAQLTYEREELVPGAFFEYTFTHGDEFTAVAGIRGDFHNQYGFFATPRLHLRYAPMESTVVRASAGRGQRTASIFAENIGAFASSRTFVVHAEGNDKPYGMDAEVAWNFGLNLTQQFKFFDKEMTLGVDMFHTRFQNQIVVDYERSTRELHFYNLEGDSYANSVQAQLDIELLPRWDMRIAYRFNDVWVDYSHGKKEKPLTSRFRAFINTGYKTEGGWGFDFTANWLGSKRIPDTSGNPEQFRLKDRSPDFVLFNAQMSKKWKSLEIYVGGENLLDYRQDNPILSADNPKGENFDASLVWGPVMGRRLYAGLRWRLE